MKKRRILLLMACFLFVMSMGNAYGWVLGWGGGIQYDKARYAVKHKRYDIALMEFRSVVKDFPNTAYARESVFAMGEYYYDNKAYYDAIGVFSDYLKNYPNSNGAVFARAYLLKIMEGIQRPVEEDKKAIDDMKKAFFSKPVLLLFSNYKERSYKTAFRNKLKIRYYLDAIEIYRNGQLFVKITQ